LGTNANPLVIGNATPYATTLATLQYTGANATSTLPIALGSGGGAIAVFSGTNLTLAGPITGGGLTLNGAGTVTVTGNSNSVSSVSVASGATLSGTGNIGGVLTINSNGILSPHTSSTTTATLSTGGLSVLSGAKLNFNLGSPGTTDAIAVTGIA